MEIFELINGYKPKNYLEIGIFRGDTFFRVESGLRVGVDPSPAVDLVNLSFRQAKDYVIGSHTIILPIKSDKFFEINDIKYDLVFVDGFHEYCQAKRDILSAMNVLNDNGIVLVHDTNPNSAEATKDYYPGIDSGEWNGDTWKVLAWLKEAGLEYFTYNVPFGLTCIKKQPIPCVTGYSDNDIKSLNYDYFDNNREDLLKLRDIRGK